MIILYGILNCDMIKCVCVWFVVQGIEYQFYDYKKVGVLVDYFVCWLVQLGWEKVVNCVGMVWCKLDDVMKVGVVDVVSVVLVLMVNLSVIKWLIVEWVDGLLMVGFVLDNWEGKC